MPPTIAIFQHAASEGPGRVAAWLEARGFDLEFVRWWQEPVPSRTEHWEGLVILGGAMNIYQHRDFPWLAEEKTLLAGLLERGVPILGICLGAQLLADQLGSRVVQNAETEIGWWPVRFAPAARSLYSHLPAECTVLHWHGDTFGLPPESTRLAESEVCSEQGFLFGDNILGLQFHPEVDAGLLQDFCGDGTETWPEGNFVQNRAELLHKAPEYFEGARAVLDGFMEALFGPVASADPSPHSHFTP